jgi:hypothetical protein
VAITRGDWQLEEYKTSQLAYEVDNPLLVSHHGELVGSLQRAFRNGLASFLGSAAIYGHFEDPEPFYSGINLTELLFPNFGVTHTTPCRLPSRTFSLPLWPLASPSGSGS